LPRRAPRPGSPSPSAVLPQLISVANAAPLGGLWQIGVLIAFSESDLLAHIRLGVCRGTWAPGRLGWAEGKNIDIDVSYERFDPSIERPLT
jgi:hypothetical protein